MVLFAAASIVLLLGLQLGGSVDSWSDGRVIACLIVAVSLFIMFCIVEKWRGSDAITPGYIVTRRTVAVSLIYTSFLDGAYFILTYQVRFALQTFGR